MSSDPTMLRTQAHHTSTSPCDQTIRCISPLPSLRRSTYTPTSASVRAEPSPTRTPWIERIHTQEASLFVNVQCLLQAIGPGLLSSNHETL